MGERLVVQFARGSRQDEPIDLPGRVSDLMIHDALGVLIGGFLSAAKEREIHDHITFARIEFA